MTSFLDDLYHFIFDIQNIWLILLSIITLSFYKIYEKYLGYLVAKKFDRNLQDKIDTTLNYYLFKDKLLEAFEKGVLNQADLIQFEEKYDSDIDKQLNILLENVWNNKKSTLLYKAGLSEKSAQYFMELSIRRIYFKYWELQDLLKLTSSKELSTIEKCTTVNNLTGYPGKMSYKLFPKLKKDKKLQIILNKNNISSKNDIPIDMVKFIKYEMKSAFDIKTLAD